MNIKQQDRLLSALESFELKIAMNQVILSVTLDPARKDGLRWSTQFCEKKIKARFTLENN